MLLPQIPELVPRQIQFSADRCPCATVSTQALDLRLEPCPFVRILLWASLRCKEFRCGFSAVVIPERIVGIPFQRALRYTEIFLDVSGGLLMTECRRFFDALLFGHDAKI